MATVDMQQQIERLDSLRRQTRIWQLSIWVILLVLVIGCILTLRNAAFALADPGKAQDEFVSDLSAKLQENTLPKVTDMGTQALREINWQAEAQKLNKRTPELARASEEQIKLLANNLSASGKKVLDSTFDKALKDRESKIRGMYPDATPEQISGMLTALSQEAKEQAGDISTTLFAPHKQALDGIVADFNTIKAAEAPNIKGDEPTWEMGLLVFDIARADLKGLEQPTDTKAKKQTSNKEKKG